MIDAQKYPNEHYLDSHVNNKATSFEYENNNKNNKDGTDLLSHALGDRQAKNKTAKIRL